MVFKLETTLTVEVDTSREAWEWCRWREADGYRIARWPMMNTDRNWIATVRRLDGGVPNGDT